MAFDSRNEITTFDDSRRLNISLAADSLHVLNATLPNIRGVPRNQAAVTIAEELRKVCILPMHLSSFFLSVFLEIFQFVKCCDAKLSFSYRYS